MPAAGHVDEGRTRVGKGCRGLARVATQLATSDRACIEYAVTERRGVA